MGSEVHPGNGHISKNPMNTQNSSQHGLFTNFNPVIKFEFNESLNGIQISRGSDVTAVGRGQGGVLTLFISLVK